MATRGWPHIVSAFDAPSFLRDNVIRVALDLSPATDIESRDVLTSSPSLRNLGALTKARLSVLSWPGLLTLVRTSVSPDRTLLTFACEIGIMKFQDDWLQILEEVQGV